jgi:DNA mismatch repair protein MutL
MRKIFQLPPHIISQIAAGEIIERPAFAVKELLENSIDANADHIQIFLEEAGLKKIMVIDNGEGMSRDDIQEAYKHHTTSKFSEEQQLIGIRSFGFRGEALSSISSVSEITIKSRTIDDEAGTSVQLHYGKLVNRQSIGIPPGTQIIVENLFSTIPARKKFLKSSRTEFKKSMEIVLQSALAHPNIHMSLTHNKKLIFDFPKHENANERIKALFGFDVFSQMVPVTQQNDFITMQGFISKPHLMSTNTSKQYQLLNRRSIWDKLISQAVKEAYGTMLDASSFPLFVLFIQLPHEMVDVNVHPRKEQIAFINSNTIYANIKEAIVHTLTTNNLNYGAISSKDNPFFSKNMPMHASNILRDEVIPWDMSNIAKIIKTAGITQIHNLYLITQTYNGLLTIDQHAAHERILYEQFTKAFNKQKKFKEKYRLPEAKILELSPFHHQQLEETGTLLNTLGFYYEDFGKDGIKITHIPLFFKDHSIETLFLELLENPIEETTIDTQSQKMLAFLACRSAVKAGDKLTKKQCKEIIEQLEETPNNYTCPHGRPTKVEIPLKNINRMFKRY